VARLLDEMAGEGCCGYRSREGSVGAPRFPGSLRPRQKAGLIIVLFTNGTLITPKLAGLSARLPPFVVSITVYGRTKATYEAVTGVRGLTRSVSGVLICSWPPGFPGTKDRGDEP